MLQLSRVRGSFLLSTLCFSVVSLAGRWEPEDAPGPFEVHSSCFVASPSCDALRRMASGKAKNRTAAGLAGCRVAHATFISGSRGRFGALDARFLGRCGSE